MPGSTASFSLTQSCQANGGVLVAILDGVESAAAYDCFLYKTDGSYFSIGALNEQGIGWTFSALANAGYTLEASETGSSGGSPGDGVIVASVPVTVACNLNGFPASGSFLRLECRGVDQYRITANGEGGEVATLEEANSAACGYTPPVDPDPEPEPVPEAVWAGLWAPGGISVAVTPKGEGAPAFVEAELYAGFWEGHPLAETRPLSYVSGLRATVGLNGEATFNLAPYLQPEVRALQVDGSRRLDINSDSAQTQDRYVGYQLMRENKVLARGYALDSVLSTQQLQAYASGRPLTPFGSVLPVWAGHGLPVSVLDTQEGLVQELDAEASGQRLVHLPCPRYGLPVAWLSPEGGFGYWVFSGQPVHGDEVGEGQSYNEAGTQELRYSSRAASRATVEAYSGVFSERAFVEGLRMLRRAVQAWYQPEGPGTEWVAITLKGGSFPAYREGRRRYEATISFTEARPQLVQGQ